MYRDIIKDTEIYQIILREGREEGREEGCEALQQVILLSVKDRFPELAEQATERVSAITDLSELRTLALSIVSAKSVDQVSALLYGLRKNEGH